MVRLITTDIINREKIIDTNLKDKNIEVFSYFQFEKYSAFVSSLELQNDLYSLNLLSKKYLLKENFLIYMSDFEYSICFDHKTIYSLKIMGDFKINDLIKSVLITKNLIMLLGGGSSNKIYFLIDSEYEELYTNILRENLKNEKGEYSVNKLGNLIDLTRGLVQLETKKKFLYKYLFLGVMLLLSVTVSFTLFSKESKDKPIEENYKKLEIKLDNLKGQLAYNQKKLNEINSKFEKDFGSIQKVSK